MVLNPLFLWTLVTLVSNLLAEVPPFPYLKTGLLPTAQLQGGKFTEEGAKKNTNFSPLDSHCLVVYLVVYLPL